MVLPTQRAPARKSCSTHTAFATAEGCESRHVGLPQPVFQPATSITSLTAKHNPSSMPLPVGCSNVVRKALLCATLIEEHFIPGTLDGRWAIRDLSSKNDGFQAVTPCAPVSRRARSAPNDNHQDRGTKGPCLSSQELPDRFHRLDLPYLHRFSSNVRALFAASPYLANGMTCDQSFQVTDFLRTTRS